MAARFVAPDLTLLPKAALIDELDFEAVLADQKQYVLDRWEEIRTRRPDLPQLTTLGLETEPMTIVLETYAYRETILRALINDKARAIMLAYAQGTDLDHLAARFEVARMPLPVPEGADRTGPRPYTTNPEDWESDERLRRRTELAPEAFSTAGARGAYIFHALSLDVTIADAWAYTPKDGFVDVVVMGADGADVTDAQLAALVDHFAQDDIVPLTDAVSVRRAQRVDYSIGGKVLVPAGYDGDALAALVGTRMAAYADANCRIGATLYRDGLIAAGKSVGGVLRFIDLDPTDDIVTTDAQVPHLIKLDGVPAIALAPEVLE